MSYPYRYYICDVFTDHPFGGIPLAVFPKAEGLSTSLMRKIAGELNFPRTAFVLPPKSRSGTHRLRTFSPSEELPVGYHASIGTALVLAWNGDVPPFHGDRLRFAIEYGAAPFEVFVPIGQSDCAVVHVATGRRPEPGPLPPPSNRIAQALSLHCSDLMDATHSPRIIRSGLNCLFVPLRSLDAMRRLRLKDQAWAELSETCGASCIYAFTHETVDADLDMHTRFLAPTLGMAEEPATGCAAVGLASLLAEEDPRDSVSAAWRVEQGIEIGRPSKLIVEAEKRMGHVSRLCVGGSGVYVGQGEIEVDIGDGNSRPLFGTGRRAERDCALAVS